MLQTIFTIILFFGGLFMYLLNLLTFESRIPNIYRVLGVILALIPAVGLISYTIMYLYDVFNYQKEGFYWKRRDKNTATVRGTRLNRALFNDIDWASYDEDKKAQREEELRIVKEKAEAAAKKAEDDRRSKLLEGLNNTGTTVQIAPIVEQAPAKRKKETRPAGDVKTLKKEKTIDIPD